MRFEIGGFECLVGEKMREGFSFLFQSFLLCCVLVRMEGKGCVYKIQWWE